MFNKRQHVSYCVKIQNQHPPPPPSHQPNTPQIHTPQTNYHQRKLGALNLPVIQFFKAIFRIYQWFRINYKPFLFITNQFATFHTSLQDRYTFCTRCHLGAATLRTPWPSQQNPEIWASWSCHLFRSIPKDYLDTHKLGWNFMPPPPSST